MSSLPPISILERAVTSRDTSYDGLFVFGVRTTGIFCRPSCTAKSALPKNRVYFPTPGDALRAGFRPCKRCRPLTADARPPWIDRLVSTADSLEASRVRDADLRALNLEPARVRRYFKRHYGMTFHAWHRSRRMSHAHRELQNGESIEAVAHDTGFASTSGFRDAFTRTFGAAPGSARASTFIATAQIESPVGQLLAGACDEGVCLLEFADPARLDPQLATLRRHFGLPTIEAPHPMLDRLRHELTEYFAGTRRDFTVPLLLAGTPFQQAVWRTLQTIPYGETRSYEWLAAELGKPRGVRAVGQANGRNRIAIVIPCHRVINKGGRLGGYGGGLARKQWLLDLERSNTL